MEEAQACGVSSTDQINLQGRKSGSLWVTVLVEVVVVPLADLSDAGVADDDIDVSRLARVLEEGNLVCPLSDVTARWVDRALVARVADLEPDLAGGLNVDV